VHYTNKFVKITEFLDKLSNYQLSRKDPETEGRSIVISASVGFLGGTEPTHQIN